MEAEVTPSEKHSCRQNLSLGKSKIVNDVHRMSEAMQKLNVNGVPGGPH